MQSIISLGNFISSKTISAPCIFEMHFLILFRKLVNFVHLDSPATTSSVTYKIQCQKNGGSTMMINRRRLNDGVGITSQITAMEVTG